jgi:hypothetical protein
MNKRNDVSSPMADPDLLGGHVTRTTPFESRFSSRHPPSVAKQNEENNTSDDDYEELAALWRERERQNILINEGANAAVEAAEAEAAAVEAAAVEAEEAEAEEAEAAAAARNGVSLPMAVFQTGAALFGIRQPQQNPNDLRFRRLFDRNLRNSAAPAPAAPAPAPAAPAAAGRVGGAGAQPRLGCRPDATNTACIGTGALAGAAFGGVPGACVGAACGLGAAVKRRFTGQGRKSRKKRGRKHKGKTRKRRKKKTKKRRKKNRKKRTKRRR